MSVFKRLLQRHRQKKRLKSFNEHFTCKECKEFCGDSYMVNDKVWRAAGIGRGSLHLKCLEKRLGRRLYFYDFKDRPINGALFFGYQMAERDFAELYNVHA